MKSPLKTIFALCGVISIQLLAGTPAHSQDKSVFQYEVETPQKPWTGTHFYNDPHNFQFLLVSDRSGGIRQGVFKKAVDKINLLYPEFVLSVGDLIQGYTKDTAQIRREWAEVNEMIAQLKMPFFYLPGNHDITNRVMAEEWEKRYGKRYYHFLYKNTLFIILDSNDDDDHNLTREQTDFVLNTIGQHGDVRWTFVLMHHPIWKYDTDGRFGEIENALAGRKHTILAGHEHHYHHEAREHANYYILATTGGGSRLRGKYFGEFDHVTWVTMTDDGPVMANLELDGILPHDVANSETREMARGMLENTTFTHLMLCNPGDEFTDGTLYFLFQNKARHPLHIDLHFYHQHQLNVHQPKTTLELKPGAHHMVQIPFDSEEPIEYGEIEALQIDWKMRYDHARHPGFQLSGNYDLEVRPTVPDFVKPEISRFTDEAMVTAQHPFNGLLTIMQLNGTQVPVKDQSVKLHESATIALHIENEAGQKTSTEVVTFEKTKPIKAKRVRKPKEGLQYAYFEGHWDKIPDFGQIDPVATGVATDLLVGDIARREDHFGVVYRGYFYASYEGMYVFRTRADDACRLIMAGEVVVNQDADVRAGQYIGAIALQQGYHPVEIHFLEHAGNERLRLYKRKPAESSWEYLEVEGNFYH